MRAKEIWLFTNRNTMIFDEYGEQIPKYQKAINCYHVNKKIALKATAEADKFFIARFREWAMNITREEIQYLLDLRTKEMDMREKS